MSGPAEGRAAEELAGSSPADPSPDPSAESDKHLRQAKLGAYGLFTLGLSALLLLLARGCAPVGTIRGEVVAGQPARISLVDVPRDVYREGTLRGARYQVALPPFAREPRVFVYGAGPEEHWVESSVLPIVEGEQEAPPIGLWSTPLDIGVREGQLRFDWAPLPSGPGFPGKRRYSILLRYARLDRELGEVTLLCDEPKRGMQLEELRDLLKEWDPQQPELTVELRGYDPGEQQGALWVGRRRTWKIPPAPPAPSVPPGRSE